MREPKLNKEMFPFIYRGMEVGIINVYYDGTAMCKMQGPLLNSEIIKDLFRNGFEQNPDDFTEFYYDPLNQVKE